MGPFSSFFMCSCVLLPPGRFGPLRAEVVVGLGRVRLVQALLSSPSSAGLVPCPSSLRFFLFPCLFRVRPLGARFHVLVFSPSLFFCVPLSASWLSNFHLIVIFTSFSFPFFFIFISWSGPYFLTLLREGVCVWTICIDVKLLTLQGAAGNVIVLQPTKTAMTFCDIDLGRWIDVPAINFSSMATG